MLVEKRVFENVKSIGSHRVFEGIELVRCEFLDSHLAQFDDADLNLVVRDVTATRCVVKRLPTLQGVRLENVLIDGLSGSRTWLSGCAFRNVTLRGRISQIMFQPPNSGIGPQLVESFTSSIVRYYQDVDWAIDISEAEFTATVNFFFVPGDLVRRDVETQYLLRREVLAGVDLDRFPVYAQIEARRFEATPFDSIVAVAPRRGKDFPAIKAALDELRAANLAE